MITLFKDPFFDVFDKVFEPSYVGTTSVPQINIRKGEGEYRLIMSVPGLTKDDIKITTKEGVLSIFYEKEENTDKTYFVSSFKKSYTIPEGVKEKDIEGKVENGILTLTLPIEKKKSLERFISLN
jgi:HSP20 family protein